MAAARPSDTNAFLQGHGAYGLAQATCGNDLDAPQ